MDTQMETWDFGLRPVAPPCVLAWGATTVNAGAVQSHRMNRGLRLHRSSIFREWNPWLDPER